MLAITPFFVSHDKDVSTDQRTALTGLEGPLPAKPG